MIRQRPTLFKSRALYFRGCLTALVRQPLLFTEIIVYSQFRAQLLSMTVNRNSHILCQRFFEDICYMATDKANMMFISILANMAH